jgi:hypothetical protein
MAVVVPRTKPSKLADPFGKANMPKAKAIGPIPLPKFEIKRAVNNLLTYGRAKTSLVSNLPNYLFRSCN